MKELYDLVAKLMELADNYTGEFNNLRYDITNRNINDHENIKEVLGDHVVEFYAEDSFGSTAYFMSNYHRGKGEFYISSNYEHPSTSNQVFEEFCKHFKIDIPS